jgi:hypothetical protein
MFIEKVPRKKALLLLYSLMAGLGFLFFIPGFKENIVPTAIILALLRYPSIYEDTYSVYFPLLQRCPT